MPKGKWNILNTVFLMGTLALAVVLVPWHLMQHGFRWMEWGAFLFMTFLCGTGISLGYHRLFSHRAFKASLPVRLFGLLFGAANFENSALQWSSDHRIHHRYCDHLEKDPYAIGKGFWWAHWGWVMKRQAEPIQNVADLQKDPLVLAQHRFIFPIGAAVSFLPLLLGFAGGDLLGLAIVAVLLRIVVNHHTTFFINSAAHVFGARPYTETNSARDNWLLAPLTYGEGFHNFHHMWQWDYRNGALWYQWDSTKWILNLLGWMGLASDFRRVPQEVMDRARVATEQARVARSLEEASPLRQRLEAAGARLEAALFEFQTRKEAWHRAKKEWKTSKTEQWQASKAEWRATLAAQKQDLVRAWAEWRQARREALTHA